MFNWPKLLLLFILISSRIAYSDELCNSYDFRLINSNSKVKSIDIDINKYRKWVKNYFKAITDQGYIDDKFKKRFKSNLSITFEDGLICNFPAKIRISGDKKDHVNSVPPITSLDVALSKGNVKGSVSFKLFIPATRSSDPQLISDLTAIGESEILTTLLLRELDFLAPLTYPVEVDFNGVKTKLLFQEKITKEFLEKNNLREAPIIEGNERFLFSNKENIQSHLISLARVNNSKWVRKGQISEDISRYALSKMNISYIDFMNRFRFKKITNAVDLDTSLINQNPLYEDRIKAFESILIAMGGVHGLRPHNRKFYFDPLQNSYIPIYYDSNSKITNLPQSLKKIQYFAGVNLINNDEIVGAKKALNLISKLDLNLLHIKAIELGLNYSLNEIQIMIENLKNNLKRILILPKNKEIQSDPSNFYSKVGINNKFLKSKYLVFYDHMFKKYEVCDFMLQACKTEILNSKQISKLLGGRLKLYGQDLIFIGNKKDYLNLSRNFKNSASARKIKLTNDVELISFSENADINIQLSAKEITIKPGNSNDRFVFYGGILDGWKIKYINNVKEYSSEKQRFDQNLITGCLNFYDIELINSYFFSENAKCEDGVNFVRVKGYNLDIEISNSKNDALDADFSSINFSDISVDNSGNDCLDFSSGKYNIKQAQLSNCNDKAVSVGEKSLSKINKLNISSSNIAIASKDSSLVEINEIKTKIINKCLSAYKKKQEFWGGKIIVNKSNCSTGSNFADKFSEIVTHEF